MFLVNISRLIIIFKLLELQMLEPTNISNITANYGGILYFPNSIMDSDIIQELYVLTYELHQNEAG